MVLKRLVLFLIMIAVSAALVWGIWLTCDPSFVGAVVDAEPYADIIDDGCDSITTTGRSAARLSQIILAVYDNDANKAADKSADTDKDADKSDDKDGSASDEISILMVDDDESNRRVVDRFEKLGAKVTMVPVYTEDLVDDYDALIIPGGNNVTPSLYGEEMSEFTSDTDLEKDKTQIMAVIEFAKANKPVFGICRGCQLINVAFGGTIDQGNGEYHKGWHEVEISPDSIFYPVYGPSVNAYHYHKQKVKDLGEGFVATQWAADDSTIIEAIEHKTLPIYGLQWHCDAVKMKEAGEKACQAFIDVVKEHKTRQRNTGVESPELNDKELVKTDNNEAVEI